jgi:hypothetical protein
MDLRIAPLVLLLLVSAGQPVAAQFQAQFRLSEKEALAKLRDFVREGVSETRSDSFTTVGSVRYGVGTTGSGTTVPLRLAAGEHYFITVACDLNCTDIDLYVKGPNGQEVAADFRVRALTEEKEGLLEDHATVEFIAPLTGSYEALLKVERCSAPRCNWAFIVFRSTVPVTRPIASSRSLALGREHQDSLTIGYLWIDRNGSWSNRSPRAEPLSPVGQLLATFTVRATAGDTLAIVVRPKGFNVIALLQRPEYERDAVFINGAPRSTREDGAIALAAVIDRTARYELIVALDGERVPDGALELTILADHYGRLYPDQR